MVETSHELFQVALACKNIISGYCCRNMFHGSYLARQRRAIRVRCRKNIQYHSTSQISVI